jgi:hypothetical protein
MHTSSRDQHLEMITMTTGRGPLNPEERAGWLRENTPLAPRKPELPNGDQLATYLASVGQIPGMPTYSVKAALQAVWEWGYQAGKVDAASDALEPWPWAAALDAAEDRERRFPEGSTDSKFNRTDGE